MLARWGWGWGWGLGGRGLGAVVGVGGKGVRITWHIIFANYLSNVKMSNTLTMEEVRKKKTWHNEVQTLWGQIWPHMWTSPKHLENIFYEHFVVFWWSSNLTSKLTSSYLSLIMSSFFLLTSSIDQVFDILTFGK